LKQHFLLLAILLHTLHMRAEAQVILPAILCDSMILQRNKPIKIWGEASPGEKITIDFLSKRQKIKADALGKWTVQFPEQQAGGPYSMQINASNKIILQHILIGDVWFCSGQSNMVHQLNIHDVTYASEIANANYPQIRQFLIPTLTNLNGPQENMPKGSWRPAIGQEVRPFSAVAYFFAKKIHEKYGIPIGIINASVGGTPIEAWTSEQAFIDFPEVLKTIEKNKDTAYINGLSRRTPPSGNSAARQQPGDLGLSGEKPWYAADYIPKGWRNINVPGYWEDQGIKNLDGAVWYRKEINVPATMVGKAAKVWLGRIVDADALYINGKQVGNTTYQYPQRRYSIEAGLLKAGKNLVVVRVTNNTGKGGFVPDKPYCLFAGNDTVDLTGTWQYKVGEVFERRSGLGGGGINAQGQPTALYNAMVAPIINQTIKGILWYQGESNAGKPLEYEKLQKALIADWRSKWNDPNLPFLYVQLPNFMEVNYSPEESNWAILRNAQLKALEVPNTGMAVAIDLGEWNDIHPDNKKDVGERLAFAALKVAYGEKLVYSGPVLQSANVAGDQITLSFQHIGSGLMTNDGEPLSNFAIAGEDKKFVWANARIEGDKVVVWHKELPNPKYVRYAWADNPSNPNLYNKEGLPATPFSTAD
jgi:sialate O-acetylesterase